MNKSRRFRGAIVVALAGAIVAACLLPAEATASPLAEDRGAGTKHELIPLTQRAWQAMAGLTATVTDSSALVQVAHQRGPRVTSPVVTDPLTCGIAPCTHYVGKSAANENCRGRFRYCLVSGPGPWRDASGHVCRVLWIVLGLNCHPRQPREEP